MTLESVESFLIESFQILDGISKGYLNDNMSSIMNYLQDSFTKVFKLFTKNMGFIPKYCKVEHKKN